MGYTTPMDTEGTLKSQMGRDKVIIEYPPCSMCSVEATFIVGGFIDKGTYFCEEHKPDGADNYEFPCIVCGKKSDFYYIKPYQLQPYCLKHDPHDAPVKSKKTRVRNNNKSV